MTSPGPTGSKIYSTADGTVVVAGTNGGYGNSIDIDHGFGIVTRYGHLSEILVKEGQIVHKGDIIGVKGSTGHSSTGFTCIMKCATTTNP